MTKYVMPPTSPADNTKAKVKLSRPAPSWNELYVVAESQQGCFTTTQARKVGFSDQLLQTHLKGGKVERLHRGIYRLTRFPASSREQEHLMVVWLWSDSTGVFSHETALQLHGLSDALPSRIHVTLPREQESRSLTPPDNVRLYFADLPPQDCTFVGALPATTPSRTINDVAAAFGDANVIEDAARQALQRGAAGPADLLPAIQYLAAPRGGFRRIPPEALANPNGTWLMEIVSGICEKAPPSDWRVEAQELATAHHGRLHAAQYFATTRTISLELVWPVGDHDTKPTTKQLRKDAKRRFGWVN